MEIKKNGGIPVKIHDLDTFIKNWRPIDGWLISDKNQYVLPTHHSAHGRIFYSSYCKKVKTNLMAIVSCLLSVILLLVFKPVENNQALIVVFSLLLLFSICDGILSVWSINSCRQKIEFLFNFKSTSELHGPPLALLMCVMYSIQWLLEVYYGSQESLIISVGNYYPEIDIFSSWRFITGAFLHGDLQHWILNTLLAILFASTIPKTKLFKTVLILILGAATSHCITYFYHLASDSSFDCLLGISGGVFALLAYSVIAHLRQNAKSTALTLFAIMVLSELSLALLTDNSSHTAHISGFLFGITIALLNYSKPHRSNQ